MLKMTHAVAVALLAATGTASAHAATVGDALDRPAINVRAPQHSVLLSAARAGTRLIAVGERGVIVLSDDGGRQWRQVVVPTSVTLTAVKFIDAKVGWAIGHGGVVLATQDAGEHWLRQLDGRRAAQIVLKAAKSIGNEASLRDANQLVADGPDKPLLDLLVFDRQNLLVVGAFGLALASSDGGQTWTSWTARLPNPKGLHLYAARAQGNTVLLAGEQGIVLLSNDRGASFVRLDVPYKGSFFAAEMLSERDLIVAGLRGNLLRSADAGVTWSATTNPMPVTITGLTQRQGEVLAANQAGVVLALKGNGMVPIDSKPLPPLNGLLPLADGALLVVSVHGVLTVPSVKGSAQ